MSNESVSLINELTSYIYGIVILLSIASFMLLIHLYLAFFFHN